MPELTLSEEEFQRFRHLVERETGVHLSAEKKALLVGRLGKRVRALGLPSFAAYYHHLVSAGDVAERERFIDLVTTHETYFFREPAHFEFLRDELLSRHSSHRAFVVWCAAASAGEEVYTVAMVLAEALGINGNWSILGTDISKEALAHAERAIYVLAHTRGLPEAMLKKYCLKGVGRQAGNFRIAPELRRHVRFRPLNLVAPLPADLGRFHAIFLRNVLIYFEPPVKRQVVAQVLQHLQPGGVLFLGHAESLHGLGLDVQLVRPSIYRLPG